MENPLFNFMHILREFLRRELFLPHPPVDHAYNNMGWRSQNLLTSYFTKKKKKSKHIQKISLICSSLALILYQD